VQSNFHEKIHADGNETSCRAKIEVIFEEDNPPTGGTGASQRLPPVLPVGVQCGDFCGTGGESGSRIITINCLWAKQRV